MAKKNQGLLTVMILLGVLLVGLYSTGFFQPGAMGVIAVDSLNGSYELSGVTNLTNTALKAGDVVAISGLIENTGTRNITVYIQAGFYAEKNEALMATISPANNCVAAESDSITAIKVEGLKPGDRKIFSIPATVPKKTSVLKPSFLNGSTLNNWDDRFYEQVGVYAACGEAYYDSVVYSGVVVSDTTTGTTPVAAEECKVTNDCSGWLLNNLECKNNLCVAKPSVDVFGNFKSFYDNNVVLFWAGVGVLFLVLILVLMRPPQQ